MKNQIAFRDRLLAKAREQIRGRRTGFLLGAGASFLNGEGYPLAPGLWSAIKAQIDPVDQALIEAQISQDYLTLEQALDAIDRGRGDDFELRHRVTSAIASTFVDRRPPLEIHRIFVARLAKRNDKRIPVFCLNYDPLIELAADQEEVNVVDGFCGLIECHFQPSCFIDFRGMVESRRGRSVPVQSHGVINLYKLHGSLGWYVDQHSKIRRIRPDMNCPDGWWHLMIPPQNRKAADTGITPYAVLWSEFRAHLANDSTRLLNRLVCVGYGLGDGHVNAVIDSALARSHFTLVILTKALTDDVFDRWRVYRNTLIVTETRSSLYGEEGPGMQEICAFEWLAKEV